MGWDTLWYVTFPALFVGRQLLLWLAYRGLAPRVQHRMTLPDGFRLREQFSPGWLYYSAKAAGFLLAAYVIAPTAHLGLLLVDRGWSGRLAIVFAIFLAGAALLLALDRWLESIWCSRAGLRKDWRARAG